MTSRDTDPVMRRVLIIGSGGAGKSVLAVRAGQALGLPVIHLDQENWRPGWVETPRDEWHARVDVLLAREYWIMDGNYGGTSAADTAAWIRSFTRISVRRSPVQVPVEPALAGQRAEASPIPDDAPVTSATRTRWPSSAGLPTPGRIARCAHRIDPIEGKASDSERGNV